MQSPSDFCEVLKWIGKELEEFKEWYKTTPFAITGTLATIGTIIIKTKLKEVPLKFIIIGMIIIGVLIERIIN